MHSALRREEQVATAKLIEAIDELVKVRVREALNSLPSAQLDPRGLRVSKGLEIQDVARRSGVAHSTISRLERGLIKRLSPVTLDKISRALGIAEPEFRAAVAAMLQRTVA